MKAPRDFARISHLRSLASPILILALKQNYANRLADNVDGPLDCAGLRTAPLISEASIKALEV
jgi:hypothetical protein